MLLMIAHPTGRPYITNDPEVAAAVQIAEEIRYTGIAGISHKLVTQIAPSIRQQLIVDFGGCTVVGWNREVITLLDDAAEFAFWPHQFSGVLEAVIRAHQDAEQEGYGILMDDVFPVALSLQDLAFLRAWLRENEPAYRLQEQRCLDQFKQGYEQLLAREGCLVHHIDDIPFPATPIVPGPQEVQ